jgi:hypothetical protein
LSALNNYKGGKIIKNVFTDLIGRWQAVNAEVLRPDVAAVLLKRLQRVKKAAEWMEKATAK